MCGNQVCLYLYFCVLKSCIYIYLLERALQLGSLFSPEEALKIGLVDKLVPDMETATVVAEAELKEFLQIPGT